MKAWIACLVAGAAAAAAGFGGYWYGHTRSQSAGPAQHSAAVGASASGPVVPVRTAPIRLKTITETNVVYGRVVAPPGKTRVQTLPFETVIRSVLVTAGQHVPAGTPLLKVSSSPAARLRLQQAKDAYTLAVDQLKQVEWQYGQRLAVKKQLLQARQAVTSARLKLSTLEGEGVGRDMTLKAQSDGIVSKIAAQEGQILGSGSPLLEIASGDQIEVRLGVEPEDIAHIHEGDPVAITPVHLARGSPVTGHIRLITKRVNPATQMIDVLVGLPPDADLMLSAFVRATLVRASRKALVVPRGAVLPGANGFKLFTINNGHAVKHIVQLGLETDDEVEIRADHLEAGTEVVLTGNYELQNGMAVTQQGGQ